MTTKELKLWRQRELDRAHQLYVSNHPDEYELDRFMADNGHPQGEDYRVLFADWRALRYLAGLNGKVVAFKDHANEATWERPGLDVTNEPQGSLADYWSPYANNADRRLEYLKAAAAAGWPDLECYPSLDCGRLSVNTQDYRLVADLVRATHGTCRIEASTVQPHSEGAAAPYWNIRVWRFDGVTGPQMQAALSVVRRRLRRYVPPAKTEADEVWDRAPVDLANKRFSLTGGIDHVVVTDHEVQVPLVPLNDGADELLRNAITHLLMLCRQGYPWSPDVRRWVTKWVYPKDRARFDREFGHRRTEEEREWDEREDSIRKKLHRQEK